MIAAPAGERLVGELELNFGLYGGDWRAATVLREKWKADAVAVAAENFGERQREYK